MIRNNSTSHMMTRRRLIGSAGASSLALVSSPSWARTMVDLHLPGGPSARALTTAFPQKAEMILQRTRPPLLETPWSVFDKSLFTPNDQFYVRWHWAMIPLSIDVETFRLKVHGTVARTLSLSLRDILQMPRVELAAVNQCSGNSRGFFAPRVQGGEWENGAMGNALWTGVRLKDVLDRAGVTPNAVQVRFHGLEEPVIEGGPRFMKSLAIDHARDGDVMIAYAVNGAPLPLLNGFPLRLVVPGWYATYWVKMLSDIEVLDEPDANYWTKQAYLIPDTQHADMQPGQKGVPMIPINRMVPRSFITNLSSGTRLRVGEHRALRGIAFGGDCGVAAVDLSTDGGKSWHAARLGRDEGPYSFRHWQTEFTPLEPGKYVLMVRCTNRNGAAQPVIANWNPGGFMRNVIESTDVSAD
ncbi:molybdopterin-dependent oxidoreductase [Methylovirgula sp. HY1]|uniref:molybdopterin-dependent oxidoreductase n=1 Tax=Methylovirgula sp. HY1 TaxID=2822761 RepID=UPI001C5BA93A|nr:molybdopterin-dependent oxidoreductase [Methylovirgula sp. HY1]